LNHTSEFIFSKLLKTSVGYQDSLTCCKLAAEEFKSLFIFFKNRLYGKARERQQQLGVKNFPSQKNVFKKLNLLFFVFPNDGKRKVFGM
jgi:hypothetical protein